MKKTLILAAFFCLLSSTGRAEVMKVPLYKLAPVSSVDLRCVLGESSISIPIPERWKINRARLKLHYVNSNSLLKDKSQLVVKMNNTAIGQVGLNPIAPEGDLAVSIPAPLLTAGYNTLSFYCAQHYTAQCEQYCAPNLWTALNYVDSFLEIDYELMPVPLKLSKLSGFLFDPKIIPGGAVHIVTEDLSSDAVTLAGIVASGIAVKFDYRKVLFDLSNDIVSGEDNVLIGRKEFVEAFLKRRGITITVPGSFLKIMHLPLGEKASSAKHALLVISGTHAPEITLAAESLASLTLPYPGTDEMVIRELKIPDISQYKGRNILPTDQECTFKTLDFNTHTFIGFNPLSMQASFRLPPDFLVKPNQYAKINLNFTYGAGMRSDSVLNILVNDITVRAVHLKKPEGESFEGYRIDLPTYLFKPGNNTIKLSPVLNPAHQECDVLRPEGFFLTVFENSTVYFPTMPHFVEMPKMELFMLNGFPITRRTDGSESMIYVTRSDYETAASALNIIGYLSRKNGYPLLKTGITFEKPAHWNGELIIVGDVETIPQDYLNIAPLQLSQTKVVPYPVIMDWDNESSFAISKQVSSIGPNLGVIMEFQSPHKTGRSVLLMTGAGPADVLALSKVLLDPGIQNKVAGDLAFIDLKDPDNHFKALSAGEKYYTGDSGAFFLIDYYIYKHPYLIYILLSLVLIAASLIVFFILYRIRKKRMQ